MRLKQVSLFLISIMVCGLVMADACEECERLKNAQAELAQLFLQLNAAEAAADPDARIHFRYDWLRRDLAIIRRGIQAQIDSATCAPPAQPCVRGDYRH